MKQNHPSIVNQFTPALWTWVVVGRYAARCCSHGCPDWSQFERVLAGSSRSQLERVILAQPRTAAHLLLLGTRRSRGFALSYCLVCRNRIIIQKIEEGGWENFLLITWAAGTGSRGKDDSQSLARS